MGDVMLALARTLANLRHGKVWLYVLIPALFSLLLSIGLAIWALGAVVQQMMDLPADDAAGRLGSGLAGHHAWPTSAAGWRFSPSPT
jgi:hypothetical protein